MTRSREQITDEIALREASLDDARSELAQGELSARQLETIEERERTELARLRLELARLSDVALEPVTRPRVRRTRWLVVALVCFAIVIGFVLYGALSTRQAGNSATGSISLGRAQQITQLLGEAEADVANGNVTTALAAYAQVLNLDSSNVVALTQTGWLDFSAGSAAHKPALVELGIRELERAVAIAPRQSAPHLYLGIVAASIPGNRARAKVQFEQFLALRPSKGQVAVATPFMKKLGIGP